MLLHANNLIKINPDGSSITKCFSLASEDGKARYDRELAFYKHCMKINYENCAKLISYNRTERTIEISVVMGDSPRIGQKSDLANFCDFITILNASKIKNLPNAAECFWSTNQLFELLVQRRRSISKDLISYYFDELKLEKLWNSTEVLLATTKVDCATKVINPSDLGLHNYLKNQASFSFLDFEYAGLDSVTKLSYDFALHPRNIFSGYGITDIFLEMTKSLPVRLTFDPKLAFVFSFWWILRLLSSLRPESITRKILSGVLTYNSSKDYVDERVSNLLRFETICNEYR